MYMSRMKCIDVFILEILRGIRFHSRRPEYKFKDLKLDLSLHCSNICIYITSPCNYVLLMYSAVRFFFF